MKKKLLICVSFGVLFSLGAGATIPLHKLSYLSKNTLSIFQSTITGTVSGPAGSLEGVTVAVVGTANSTITDEEGKYSIVVETGSTLRFSSVGFKTQEIEVTGSSLNVELEADDTSLEEVVVVGYGTQKKEHLTGAVSSVNVEERLGSRPIPDAGRGLQGVVPGLSVRVPMGEVGSDPVMKIRGHVGSIEGSSNPLVLVDNVEVPSIQMVNPDDIDEISVLKDAAASAIYGAKAAFGVILITTKKGAKSDRTDLTYSSNFSFQSPFKELEVAGIDGLEYSLEAHENMKGSGPAGGFWRINRESFEKAKEWQEKYGNSIKPDDPIVYGRDWIYDGTDKFGYRLYDPVGMLVKDNAFTQKHNFGVNGKKNETTYNLSFGYLGLTGMMKPAEHDDYKRLTGNINLSTRVNDFITLRGGARFADGNKRYANSLTGFGSDPWLYAYRWSRLFPTGAMEDGEYLRDPYFDTKRAHTANKRKTHTVLTGGTSIDFKENWNLQADYTYSQELNRDGSSLPAITAREPWYTPVLLKDENGDQIYVDEDGNVVDMLDGDPAYRFPDVNYVQEHESNIYRNTYNLGRHTFNAFSTYDLDIEGGHDFKFMLGTNIVAADWESHWTRNYELVDENNPQFPLTTGEEQKGSGTANWEAQAGFFGRVNYAFQNKYLFETSLRYDGTSKFPADLKWRWFPSVSAGWVISEENFMETLNPVLSFAKLRASWGLIGDQSVPSGLYLANMGVVKNNWLTSSGNQFYQLNTPGAISQSITWQDIEHLNLGGDFRFINNQLGLTFEWYQRYTKNMIIPGESLPATFGAGAPKGNYGHLRTRGWEIEVDFSHRFDNGLGINVAANLADATSIVTKAGDWDTPWENRNIQNTWVTGRRYGDIYGYVTDRLYQKDDFVYDSNGDFVQTTIVYDGASKKTNMLAGDNPVYQTYFEDGNQVMLMSPGDVKFVDVDGDGYITPGKNTFGDPGDQVVIGNSTPRYEYGFHVGGDYKGFDLSVFLQGVGKREIWGSGQLAIPGFHAKDGAMPQAIAGDFWKEDRTDAFYPRAWNLGGGNSGYVMRPQTRYMLDMSYFKVKNITIGYELPQQIIRSARLSRLRVYLSLEDFFMKDNLRGLPIDPEVIDGYSVLNTDGYNLSRTGVGNPPFKSMSFGIQVGL